MYEDVTKEEIIARVLSRLKEDDSKDADSPLYILTSDIAEEVIETVLPEVSFGIDQSNPLTCNRYYLEQFARIYHIYPNPATPALVEGEFDIEIPLDSRFSKDQINFKVIDFLRKEGDYYYYSLECEQLGEIGNVSPGRIIPILIINNLKRAYITRILIPGEEVEETEVFRSRFLASFNSKAFCANLADYYKELGELSGVGKFKVLRCMDYKGELNPEWVTIVFTDTQLKKPTKELVDEIQEYFQPLDEETKLPSHTTSGLGLASIGQLCWVEPVKERSLDFSFNLTFEADYNWGNCEERIREALEERLLKYIEDDWGDTVLNKKSYYPIEYFVTVRRSEIESLLIGLEGILDSTAIKINGKFENFSLAWDEIPVVGDLSLHNESEFPGTGDCPYDCPDCQCNHCQEKCGRLLNG